MTRKPKKKAAADARFVATWDALALALSAAGGVTITRRAIQEWKKDPRYAADCPRDRADGRKEIAAWSRFMVAHNLKRAQAHVPSEHDAETPVPDAAGEGGADVVHPPRLGGTQADWQKAVLREKAETARLDRLTLEGRLLVASELDGPLGATLVAIQNKLTMFPERTAPQVVGFDDVHEVTAILRAEVEADLTDLHRADYLGDVAEVVETLKIESAETCAQVTAAVRETLRRIGRRALERVAKVEREPEPPAMAPPAMPEEVAEPKAKPKPKPKANPKKAKPKGKTRRRKA